MPGKILAFPLTKGGAGAVKQPHVIRRKLKEKGKSLNWLAFEMGITPQTLLNHMSGRSRLNRMNFQKLLRCLDIGWNEYAGVGKYARQGLGHSEAAVTNHDHDHSNRAGL